MMISTLFKGIALYFIYLIKKSICDENGCVEESEQVYDYVVVGAGTAGCILAARLSEIDEFSVALLEAGGEPPLISKIPSLSVMMANTEVDWNYTSIPQKDALLHYPNQTVNITRGKMLGGSGSMNNMNFFRGNIFDYFNWMLDGSKCWDWKHVFKYFKRIENDKEVDVDPKYHGHCGPICITNPGRDHPFINSFLQEVRKLGYNYKDPNGDGIQTGYSYAPVNVCNNERQSTYTNYLKPVISRPNLRVETFAFVERILFDDKNRAIGVLYSRNGCQRVIKVTREVIVSAGAINSPQLLMLSGIGPREHLESLNINVLSDLPVGNHLLNHMKVELFFTKPYEDIYNNETVKQFFEGKGPLTRFAYGNAFINTRYSTNYSNPDIELSLRSFSQPVKVSDDLKYILRVVLSHPKSHGIIRLNSNNPYDYPMIDLRSLSNMEDVNTLAEGTKIGVSIMKSMDVTDYGYTMEELSVAACEQFDTNTDEYWRCIVSYIAKPFDHYSGTCKMGTKNSGLTVVDNNLRILGMKGIRVVDGSIFPSMVSGNIQAVIMMIAEKCAALIKAKALKHRNNDPF